MKKKKIDNATKYNLLIKKMYESIFKLDTKTLIKVYVDIYRELLTRDDFTKQEDTIIMYNILKDRLIEEGVYNVWYNYYFFSSTCWINDFSNTIYFGNEFNLWYVAR